MREGALADLPTPQGVSAGSAGAGATAGTTSAEGDAMQRRLADCGSASSNGDAGGGSGDAVEPQYLLLDNDDFNLFELMSPVATPM